MLKEETWYTTPWHNINTMEELLQFQAKQLKRLQTDRLTAVSNNIKARMKAAAAFAVKNTSCLLSGKYRPGKFVLLALRGNGVSKGYRRIKSANRWAGPFKIHAKY